MASTATLAAKFQPKKLFSEPADTPNTTKAPISVDVSGIPSPVFGKEFNELSSIHNIDDSVFPAKFDTHASKILKPLDNFALLNQLTEKNEAMKEAHASLSPKLKERVLNLQKSVESLSKQIGVSEEEEEIIEEEDFSTMEPSRASVSSSIKSKDQFPVNTISTVSAATAIPDEEEEEDEGLIFADMNPIQQSREVSIMSTTDKMKLIKQKMAERASTRQRSLTTPSVSQSSITPLEFERESHSDFNSIPVSSHLNNIKSLRQQLKLEIPPEIMQSHDVLIGDISNQSHARSELHHDDTASHAMVHYRNLEFSSSEEEKRFLFWFNVALEGYQTRKLWNCRYVENLKRTIQDTQSYLVDMEKSQIHSKDDQEFKNKLRSQLAIKKKELYDIFFDPNNHVRFHILSGDLKHKLPGGSSRRTDTRPIVNRTSQPISRSSSIQGLSLETVFLLEFLIFDRIHL